MPFMLKIRWDIKQGDEAIFRANQQQLCEVMLQHPGVICYHVDYPSDNVSEWVEIYANDEAFAAHLADENGQAPLGALIEASASITCRCWGDPNASSREVLVGFGASYHQTAANAFALNPDADKDSVI